MRQAVTRSRTAVAIPRGWIVLALAFGSWAMLVAFASGISQLFNFVAASL